MPEWTPLVIAGVLLVLVIVGMRRVYVRAKSAVSTVNEWSQAMRMASEAKAEAQNETHVTVTQQAAQGPLGTHAVGHSREFHSADSYHPDAVAERDQFRQWQRERQAFASQLDGTGRRQIEAGSASDDYVPGADRNHTENRQRFDPVDVPGDFFG